MPLRIAIIGCGKIADQHAAAISRIPESEIVALCDREILMARQLGERIGVEHCYSDPETMLEEVKLDVVHVTTPPQSHESLAGLCLNSGCHVYLEKPFTVTAAEAERVLSLAQTKGLRVTAGHNLQFTPEMVSMRQLISDGFLGGDPVHIESQWPYDLGDRVYVSALLGDSNHWVRRLPGKLFHNLISHGIGRIAEFLDDDIEVLNTDVHQSKTLLEMNGHEIDDELRVMIRDGKGTTAYFTFSTQINPPRNFLRICGPKQSLFVDQGCGSLVRERSLPSKSYLTFVVPPFFLGLEYLRNAPRNILRFLKRQLYQDAGMKELIEQFHKAVASGPEMPDPIPAREILLTARIMDEIFSQVYPAKEKQTQTPTEQGVDDQPRNTGVLAAG